MSLKTVNFELLKQAQQSLKRGFVSQETLGGGGAPPGGDPAAAGGMPPGGAPPGGDPSMMGGGAPPPPAGGGGGGPDIMMMIQQAVQQAMMGAGGGAAGGGAAGIKPKIDVNVTLLQILKILARIADTLGVQIPASEMVATQGDLTGFAQQQQTNPMGAPQPGAPPPDGAGGAGGPMAPPSPMEAMPGAAPGAMGKMSHHIENGSAIDPSGLQQVGDRASAIAAIMARRMQNAA